jgi:transcriptional regulator with XRE-family HTH domain
MSPDDLAAARMRLGLSISALARRVGMSPASFSLYERGLQPIPQRVEMAVELLEIRGEALQDLSDLAQEYDF